MGPIFNDDGEFINASVKQVRRIKFSINNGDESPHRIGARGLDIKIALVCADQIERIKNIIPEPAAVYTQMNNRKSCQYRVSQAVRLWIGRAAEFGSDSSRVLVLLHA